MKAFRKKEARELLKLRKTKAIALAQEIKYGKEIEDTFPKMKADCPKCKNNEVWWWTEQTRAADEPETSFFRCTKCRHTWREYD